MIGLDIGTYSIKAVELQKKGNLLLNFKAQQRPQAEPLSAALKNFFKDGSFSSKEMNISVSGPLVTARLVEMPEMKEEELDSAIRFEAEKNIPFNIDEAVLDYQVVFKGQEAKKIKVLFAAVKNDFVKEYVDAVMQAGFIVKGVDIDNIALTNAFVNTNISNGPEGSEKGTALLNVGDAFSNMSVVYQGIPFVLRDINRGGKEIAEEIAKGLGVSQEEAYQLKHAFPPDKQETLVELTRPSLERLGREARFSLGYFEDQFAKKVEAVYLSGGSARLFGLKEFLSEFLGVPVKEWDPFSSIKIKEGIPAKALEEIKAELPVALGLAIRDDKYKSSSR